MLGTLKKQLDVWRWLGETALDLGKRPVTVRQAPAPSSVPLLGLLGLVCLAVSGVVVAVFASVDGLPLRVLFPVPLAVAVGTGLLFLAALARRSGRDLSFEQDRVSVKGRWFRRLEDWSAPYTAFEGVEGKAERVLRGHHFRTFYVIRLRHPEPEKCIPLFVHFPGFRGMDSGVFAQRTKDYAQALGVPVV